MTLKIKNFFSMKNEQHTIQLLSALIFIDDKGAETIPTQEHIEKMLALCRKRSRPSYYKLRHASGLGEAYTFKDISMYSDDGKKMRRFESGLSG
ncbi:MAG: hypothetical protein Q9M39_04495 [Sulfurovum sp.]|nr:hypothetical protein [Sulfurovum sp.]